MARQTEYNQYYATRKQRKTVSAFTGEYENEEAEGTYMCVCCGQPLALFFRRRNFIPVLAYPAINSRRRLITWN